MGLTLASACSFQLMPIMAGRAGWGGGCLGELGVEGW
jgi:hypothetical protein